MAAELEPVSQIPPPVSRTPRWPWILLGLVLSGVVAAGAVWSSSRPAARWGGGGAGTLQGEVPDFRLTAEDGEPFGKSDLLGRPWVAGFIFTRCTGVCPRVMARMAGLEGAGARLVCFTVDPGHDTPAVLRDYARARGAGSRWRFLTGDAGDLARLIGEGFHLGAAADPVTHSDRLVLVDAAGRIRGSYSSGDGEAMGRLRRDLDALGR